MDEIKAEEKNPPNHNSVRNFERVADKLDEDAIKCGYESRIFLFLAFFLLVPIALVLVMLGDITSPTEHVKPAFTNSSQQIPLQLESGSNDAAVCGIAPTTHDKTASLLCKKIKERDAEIQRLNQRINGLRQPADVRKLEYEQNIEFTKNNEQLSLADRKLQADLAISRQKMTFEKDQRENFLHIANNSLWRLSLILVGFFILRHLIVRSRLARDNERQLKEKATLIRLAKYDSSPSIWLVELLSGLKPETGTNDSQELIDPSVKDTIKAVVPNIGK